MDEIRACSRRNPHTPHGACLGTAPEFPWEQIEQVGKLETARRLGTEHGTARDLPYAPADGADVNGYDPYAPDGYVSYVYWDAGSARLMDALGETSETDESNWPERQTLLRAYCEAYAEAAGVAFDTSV